MNHAEPNPYWSRTKSGYKLKYHCAGPGGCASFGSSGYRNFVAVVCNTRNGPVAYIEVPYWNTQYSDGSGCHRLLVINRNRCEADHLTRAGDVPRELRDLYVDEGAVAVYNVDPGAFARAVFKVLLLNSKDNGNLTAKELVAAIASLGTFWSGMECIPVFDVEVVDKPSPVRMTIAEIESKLGHPVEIVSGTN